MFAFRIQLKKDAPPEAQDELGAAGYVFADLEAGEYWLSPRLFWKDHKPFLLAAALDGTPWFHTNHVAFFRAEDILRAMEEDNPAREWLTDVFPTLVGKGLAYGKKEGFI